MSTKKALCRSRPRRRRSGNICSNCSTAAMPTRISKPPSATFLPRCAASGPKAPSIRPGRSWSTCASRNGTFWSFPAIPATSRPEWPGGYWPATAAPPDEKAWDKSVRAFRRDLKATVRSGRRTRRPICMRESRTAAGRPSCARHCWLPTTTPTILAKWCWCAACSDAGSEKAGSRRFQLLAHSFRLSACSHSRVTRECERPLRCSAPCHEP